MITHLFVDGGVLGGNPSSEGIYWSVAVDSPKGHTYVLVDRKQSRDFFTNNEAEYLALLEGLEIAHEYIFASGRCAGRKASAAVIIHSDSQVIVNQFNGAYRCNQDNLRPLLLRCLALALPQIAVTWVPRVETKRRLGH